MVRESPERQGVQRTGEEASYLLILFKLLNLFLFY